MARQKKTKKTPRIRFRRRTMPGAPPGQLAPDPEALAPVMSVIAYGPDELEEGTLAGLAEIDALLEKYPVVWLNVDGVGDTDLLSAIGRRFDIHPLALEDVVNAHQRAKVEQYGDQLFVVVHAVSEDDRYATEQMSLFLGERFVVTFQERPGDSFDPVRERLRKRSGRIRTLGPDYLLYALLDAAVDRYFPALQNYGDRLEELEQSVFENVRQQIAPKVHEIKWELVRWRRVVWPLREALRSLMQDYLPHVTDDTRLYLRDTADHVGQLIDLIETYREVSGGLLELHLSLASHRMNEVMKLLTMIATIFIPLSFLAGLYGMNFDTEVSPYNMPELHFRFGYPIVVFVMVSIGVGMLVYFKRKGWLGSEPE